MAMVVCVDDSVIGGYYEPELATYSQRLFHEFRLGLYSPVVSTVNETEITEAPSKVREAYSALKEMTQVIEPTEESFELADQYLIGGGFTKRMRTDCLHVATAMVYRIPLPTRRK